MNTAMPCGGAHLDTTTIFMCSALSSEPWFLSDPRLLSGSGADGYLILAFLPAYGERVVYETVADTGWYLARFKSL